MLLALFSWLGGFVIRLLPELLGIWRTWQDNGHERKMLELTAKADLAKAKLQSETTLSKSEMLLQAKDIALMREAMLKERKLLPPQRLTGIKWLDGFNSSIRSIVTLWMLTLYTFLKLKIAEMLLFYGGSAAPRYIPFDISDYIWNSYDTSLLAAIIGYHFGAQAIKHSRR